ncbi:alkaline phosphatase family protein [Flavihumibacter sp. UBA7668]|uniref:alkaline phosphatase family protein n=1 Tax=Flavihumibacter sp. UBA7668 TaxID=1946542 RepID=UPI0025C618F0|nr:alkaline phosphatase family protein [Flavihumibacter sp. UBA7668]
MNKLLLLCCLMAACSPTTNKTPEHIKHVIVIGIDGFSASGLKKAKAPVLDSLLRVGAYSTTVRTVLPTVSSPNWASMLQGAGPEQHGITSNDWELNDHTLEPVAFDSSNRFPSIFTIFRSQRPNEEAGAIYNWEGFGRLFDSSLVNLSQHYETQDATVAAYANYLIEKKPVLSWVHLDEVDGAGHHFGHGTKGYFDGILKADSCIGVIIDAIRKAGMENNTMVMIVADHGGIGAGHGGTDLEELTVPVIYFGAGIKNGYQIQQQIYQYDAAATIAFALQLETPYEWIGRPVKAAFKGFEEPPLVWKATKQTEAPVIYPEAKYYARAGGLFIDSLPRVEITTAEEKTSGTIYFTTDGSNPSSTSAKYEGPFQLGSTSVVKAAVIENGNPGKIATAYFRVLKSGRKNGVRYNFYKGDNWKKLPAFSSLKPSGNWTDYEFQLDLEKPEIAQQGNKGGFGLIAESWLEIDKEGEYQFYTRSDDGSKLYINGQLVVDNDGDHGMEEKSGKIKLTKGRHAIKIEYFDGGGGLWLDAYYKGPGLEKQIIPADKLFF